MKIIRLETVDSTNRYLRELALDGAEHGTVVLADRQTAGRGRLDHRFESPEGGLYVSLLLRPDGSLDPTLLTALAAVKTADAIEACLYPAPSIGIKWVNDLYLGGKKLAGILCESLLSPEGGASFVIVGIGINLRRVDFAPELSELATTLEDACGAVPDRDALAEEIARAILASYSDPAACLDEYRRRQILFGRRVRVYDGTRPYTARALAIDDEGGLVVSRFGRKRVLRYGEVRVRLKR